MLEDSPVVFKKRGLPRENPSSNADLTLLLQGRGLSHKNPLVMRRVLSECSGEGVYLINSSVHKGWSYCIITDKGSNL